MANRKMNHDGESDRRTAIVEAAAHLFKERGYEGTSMRELADAVGIQAGSLFYYFKSKEDILVAVMEAGLRQAQAHVERAVAKPDSPRGKLLAFFKAHLHALLKEVPQAMGVLLYEWRNLPPSAQHHLIELRDAYEAQLSEILEKAAETRLVPRQTHLYRLFLLGALNHTVLWYSPADGLDTDELAETFLAFALNEIEENTRA